MTVRLDVRPRLTLALGPPKLAREAGTPRLSGWLGGYWLVGVGLAALFYFDVVPITRLFQWGPSQATESRALAGRDDLGSPPVGADWSGADAVAEGAERLGTTEPLALSRAAYRGVHYGGEELLEGVDSAAAADAELALLDPSAPSGELGEGQTGLLGEGSHAIVSRDRVEPRVLRDHRAEPRRSRPRRPSRTPSLAGAPGAADAVASLDHAALDDRRGAPPAARPAPLRELDAEQARVAALSRAVDSALGRAAPRPDTIDEEAEPVAQAPTGRWQRASSGPSCEGAAAAYRDEVAIGEDRGPADVSREQYARVLNRGGYFRHCGAPASMGIRICAAVQNGRAQGVTVWTQPGDSAVGSCVAAAVRGLSFPSHPRLDVTTTTFAPVR